MNRRNTDVQVETDSDGIVLDEKRTTYLCDKYDLHVRQARALQMSEMGYGAGAMSDVMPVTTQTIVGYLETCRERIGKYVTATVPKPVKYDTYPNDTPEPRYSGDMIDLSPEFQERERPINRGPPVSELEVYE